MANAQFGKMMKNLENKANGVPSDEMPKGVEVFEGSYTDSMNLSGKYYTKYPVPLAIKNAMNMPKFFQMSELTLEYRHANYTGVFHFFKDECEKQLRPKNSDLKNAVDFAAPGVNGLEVTKRCMKASNTFRLEVDNKYEIMEQGTGFADGVNIYRYSKDPDILFIGQPNFYDYSKKGTKEMRRDPKYKTTGGNFNMLCKNKDKLAQWDSAKIADAIFEIEAAYQDAFSGAFASLVELPKRAVTDAARDKENFNLIMPVASIDKPAAWGDKFKFCYIVKDWQVKYKKDNPTVISHRASLVVAVSTDWPKGECRYIYCWINQPYDGKTYGKSFMAGFDGSLIPVSCESVKNFKK